MTEIETAVDIEASAEWKFEEDDEQFVDEVRNNTEEVIKRREAELEEYLVKELGIDEEENESYSISVDADLSVVDGE